MALPDPSGGVIEEVAPAKVNLALHVTGRREDGYHLLDSIATFTRDGDRLRFTLADTDSLDFSGRFGAALAADDHENLVIRARDGLRNLLNAQGQAAPPVAIHLEKNLPIAAGIGGGSADAAATLRGLGRLWQAPSGAQGHALAGPLAALALSLGADVPMCLVSRPLRARGIGEAITPLALPAFAMVLGNPLQAVSTPDIFRRLTRRDNPPLPAPPAAMDDPHWLPYLTRQRNDLETPAGRLLGAIGEISMLIRQQGALFVRMSGSGATCFGLFADDTQAEAAVATLARMRPDWYFLATRTLEGTTS